MKAYTEDEVFDLLGNVNCERDVLEIESYVHENCMAYSAFDVRLFLQSVRLLKSLFKPHES